MLQARINSAGAVLLLAHKSGMGERERRPPRAFQGPPTYTVPVAFLEGAHQLAVPCGMGDQERRPPYAFQGAPAYTVPVAFLEVGHQLVVLCGMGPHFQSCSQEQNRILTKEHARGTGSTELTFSRCAPPLF